MKLYHFNPNTWGQTYYVMSDTPENAKTALLEYLKEEYDNDVKSAFSHSEIVDLDDDYLYWKEPLSKGKLPKGYSLDEYGENKIIHAEYS